jgi:CelD/BcsL family acetyltransferase involved in cellulose biosynthesis/peptidoglycan/xylan/chitin deacetylase (PgdA/CDA1 family)
MYHELARDDTDIEAWTVLRESDFLRQIEYLHRHYDIVSLDQALVQMQSRTSRVRPMVVVTFDDGDQGNATVLLPIVEALRIPITVYIATRQIAEGSSYWFDRIINALQGGSMRTVDLKKYGLGQYEINRVRGKKNWHRISCLLEDLKSLAPDTRTAAVETVLHCVGAPQPGRDSQINPMSIADLKALAACSFVTIGAHSHCHNILTQIGPEAVEESVRLSKELLEEWSGRPVVHFAYPDGRYDDNVTDIVRRAGFHSAVTTNDGLWSGEDSSLHIPRIGIGRYDSLEQIKFRLNGGVKRFFPWRYAARMTALTSTQGKYTAVLANSTELRASRREWNALVERMRYPSVFSGWEWISTWWEYFGAERDLQTLMIYRDGELKGILPLYLSRRSGARHARVGRILSYCSAADLYPDPLDIVCAEEDAHSCSEAVLNYLRHSALEWDVLHLRFLTENSLLLRELSHAVDYCPRVEQVSVAPYVPIVRGYDDYLDGLSGNERSNIRRRRRKLIDAQGASYTDFRSDDPQQVLDALFQLHQKRAAEKRIDSSFASAEVQSFVRALLTRLHRGSVWLRGIRFGSETIAVFLGFVAGGKLAYYQLGYNPAWSEFSPGSVLLQETIREAFESGLSEYNFLQGGEAFKHRWAREVRPLYSVDLFNRSFHGQLSRSLRAAQRVLKPVGKRDAPATAAGNPRVSSAGRYRG